MKKKVMVLEKARCVGCSACVIACKEENRVPEGKFRDWVTTETEGKYPRLTQTHYSERCNHCEKAPCVNNCPTGASHYSDDGTVQIDFNKCTGCKSCVISCPYHARFVHPSGYIDKCTFCHHRDGNTACQNVCPTECIHFGDANDPNSEVAKLLRERNLEVRQPEAGTWPQVYYAD